MSAPLFLQLLLYFVLPESPRWLIATGRYKQAKETIEKAAKMNKVRKKRKKSIIFDASGPQLPATLKKGLKNVAEKTPI